MNWNWWWRYVWPANLLFSFQLVVQGNPGRVMVFSVWISVLSSTRFASKISLLCFLHAEDHEVHLLKIDNKPVLPVRLQHGLCVSMVVLMFWQLCTKWYHLHACLRNYTWKPAESCSQAAQTSLVLEWLLWNPISGCTCMWWNDLFCMHPLTSYRYHSSAFPTTPISSWIFYLFIYFCRSSWSIMSNALEIELQQGSHCPHFSSSCLLSWLGCPEWSG